MASGVRFFIFFCFLLQFDECQGWSWIVGEGRNSSLPPSCRSYCINVFLDEINENGKLILHACEGTIYGNEQWDYHTPNLPHSLSVKTKEGVRFCMDVRLSDERYDIALAPCVPNKKSQQWTFNGDYTLRNGLDANNTGLYLQGSLDFQSLYLGNLSSPENNIINKFTLVDASTIETYVPSPPKYNTSNFIQNSYLREQPNVMSIINPMNFRNTPEIYFYVCNWAIKGPLSYENGTLYQNSSCPVPSCEGTTIINLNNLKPNTIVPIMGSISQIVPTYQGLGYYLMLEVGRLSTCNSIGPTIVVTISDSNLPSSGKQFTMPSQEGTTWETFQIDFIANSNKVNVTVYSQTYYNGCGPLISSVKMYQYDTSQRNHILSNMTILSNTTSLQNKVVNAQMLATSGWVVAAIMAILNIIALFFICRMRRRRVHGSEDNDHETLGKVSVIRYTFKQIQSFTQNFSVLLGKGASASVFRGMLLDGTLIAVKRHNSSSGHEQTATTCEEMNGLGEVSILSKVHHRYVLQFLGYCYEREERMLISEYMPKGSLYDLLHGEGEKPLITWLQRMRIAYQVACGLEYLHHGANPSIVHRDIKSANILLTQDLSAKIADLGISKLGKFDATRFHTTVTDLRGSFGYIDPEYFQTSSISEKSDVFSFGVLLLELITGRKAISMNSVPLYVWAQQLFHRGDGLLNILDPDLRDSISIPKVEVVIEIAKSCVNLQGQNRPSMIEVVNLFQSNSLLKNTMHNCDEIMEMRTTDW